MIDKRVCGIGGGAARRRLDRASIIPISNFHMLSVRHMMHMRIPSHRAGAAGASGSYSEVGPLRVHD